MLAAAASLLLLSLLLFRAYLRSERKEIASSLLAAGRDSQPPGRIGSRRERWRTLLSRGRERLISLGACAVLLALTWNPLLVLLAILLLPVMRRSFRDHRARRKSAKKEGQVVELLDSLTQSLRSGLSLQQALEVSMEDVGRELGEEVQDLVMEVRAGGGLEESLLRAAERSHSPALRLTFTVLGLLHGKGGDLPRVLDRLRERVYEGLEARREMRAATSQSRVSGYLVSALPLLFLFIQAVLSPSSLRPLLATPTGNLLAMVALFLNGAAFLLIRRLTQPEV